MAVPRAGNSGFLNSGTEPIFQHPIDIGGAIQAAAGSASSMLHNAFLRKMAEQNATLAQTREAREGRIAQENADTMKAYRESWASQREAQAGLVKQEEQMRTPEFQAAYADAMTNGTPSSIAHVASIVAGHPNAGQILAPLVRQDPAMRHVMLPDGRMMTPDPANPGQMMPVMDSSTGKPVAGAKPSVDPVKKMIEAAAISRSSAADRAVNTLNSQRPRITMPVKGLGGMTDQAATASNRAGFTADSTNLAAEQTAAHQDLIANGIRPPTAAVIPSAGGAQVAPIDRLRQGLKGGTITMDHIKASTTIPQQVKDQLTTEFPAPSQAARQRIKAPPPVAGTPAQVAPLNPNATAAFAPLPKPDDEED